MENFRINLGQRITALRRQLGLRPNDVVTVDLNSLGTSPNIQAQTQHAPTPTKKPGSAAARKRMSQSQKARWAAAHPQPATTGAGTGEGQPGEGGAPPTAQRKTAGHTKKRTATATA